MRVEGDEGAVMTFSAYELGERALAWIVEERELRASLVREVRDAGVDVLAPAGFARLAFAPDSATLALDDGRQVEAKLVVGADGVRSWIRQAAGIVAAPRPYGQTAVVANFACERPHRGCARQWFRADGGVLAWLPLPERRDLDRMVGAVRACGRADGARRRGRLPIASMTRARMRWARSS